MQKVLKRVLAVAVAVSVLSGCAGEVDSVQMAPLPKVDNIFTPQTAWSRSVGDGVSGFYSTLSPAVGFDTVFVADRDGLVKALDPATGDNKWETDLEGGHSAKLSGGLVLGDGKVFVGTENGFVIALNAETGEEVWRTKVAGEVLSKPLVADGLVVVNTSSGTLQALTVDSGTAKWQLNNDVPTLALRGDSSPVAVSGGVFWGLANGRLAGAIMADGRLLWQQSIASPKGSTEIDRLVDVDATPVVAGDRLFAIGYNGTLVSIDLRSGQIAWKRNYSSATDIVVDGSEVFLITDHDHIVAVDARSGTELWQNKDLQYRKLSAPAVINGYLVAGDAEGYLHWLDTQNGEFVSQEEIDSSGIAVPPVALDDDGFIVVTRDGEINKMQIPQ